MVTGMMQIKQGDMTEHAARVRKIRYSIKMLVVKPDKGERGAFDVNGEMIYSSD
jgi:hypothetical protein